MQCAARDALYILFCASTNDFYFDEIYYYQLTCKQVFLNWWCKCFSHVRVLSFCLFLFSALCMLSWWVYIVDLMCISIAKRLQWFDYHYFIMFCCGYIAAWNYAICIYDVIDAATKYLLHSSEQEWVSFIWFSLKNPHFSFFGKYAGKMLANRW